LRATEKKKLAALRAKTDRELAVLIERRLDLAISGLQPEIDSPHRGEVEKAYAEAGVWISLAFGLPAGRREEFERRLARIRTFVEQETVGEARACAAC
jgi:hypothetical protein